MKYVVVQLGYGIFGTGETQEQAIQNSREWMDDDDRDVEEYTRDMVDGDVCLAKCSDAIAEQINLGNSQFPFEVINDILIPMEIITL